MNQLIPIRTCLAALVLCIAGSVPASASEEFRHPLCITDDSVGSSGATASPGGTVVSAKNCVVVEVTWSFSGSEEAEFDRIFAQIDGDSCRIEREDGSRRTVDGSIPYKVDPGKASLTRRWVLPAGCPVKVHGHSRVGDTVRTFRFDSAQTQNDVSSAFDWADKGPQAENKVE